MMQRLKYIQAFALLEGIAANVEALSEMDIFDCRDKLVIDQLAGSAAILGFQVRDKIMSSRSEFSVRDMKILDGPTGAVQ